MVRYLSNDNPGSGGGGSDDALLVGGLSASVKNR